MHVRLSSFAEADLDIIHAYIAENDPAAAARVVDALLSTAFQLESFPMIGRPGRIEGTRELTVPRLPYFLVYTIPDAYHVDIERILHTRLQYPTAERD